MEPQITPAMAKRIEFWRLDRLVPFARNARTHSDEQVAQIAASIAAFGFNNPVLVDTNAGIIAGHGRFLAARKLGLDEIPVVVLDHLSETQKRAYILADNRIGENAGWDEEVLAAELGELQNADWRLDLLGFSEEELARLLAETEPVAEVPAEVEEEIPEAPVEPVTRPGDIWLIGKHRLICGDCRDFRAMCARLFDGVKANVAITSPPYATQREYDPESGFKPVPPDEYSDWFRDVAANIATILAADGSYFLNIKEHAGDGERSLYVKDLVIAHRRQWGWRFVDEFCWRKTDNGVPGGWGNRFKNAWEPVFHFCRQPEIKFRPQGGRPRLGGLLRLLAEQPEVDFGERASRHRRAWVGGGPAGSRGRRWPVHRHRAPEQRGRGEVGERPGIALGSLPSGAGRVLREGVLRCRRHRLRSVPRQRHHDGRRAGPRPGRLRRARSVRRTAT